MLSRRLGLVIARYRRLPLERPMTSSTAQSSRVGVVICADFDQTITTRDTIAMLFDAANARRVDAGEQAAHARQVELLVAQYMEESRSLAASALTSPSIASHFDAVGLQSFLTAFAEVDLRSIRRVIESGTLQGLRQCDFEAVAGRVGMMEKSADVLAMASRAVVISSNWSQTMLREKLRRSGLHDVDVFANELNMSEDGFTTGDIELLVQSPSDKAGFVAQEKAHADTPVIFIGDSTNDVSAMLGADVGITLGFAVESTFVRVCRQFGICLVPLTRFKDLLECENFAAKSADTNHRVLFTANSWDEIHAMLDE